MTLAMAIMETMVMMDLNICFREAPNTPAISEIEAPWMRPPMTPDRKISTPGVLIQENVYMAVRSPAALM